jgi:hypothetical protein
MDSIYLCYGSKVRSSNHFIKATTTRFDGLCSPMKVESRGLTESIMSSGEARKIFTQGPTIKIIIKTNVLNLKIKYIFSLINYNFLGLVLAN